MDSSHPVDFQLENHVFFWLTQTLEARNRRLARELRAMDLRVPEWRALAALYARKVLTMGELADLASIDRTTLSRTIDRMEEAGWVVRISDAADMRITRLRLTDSGKALFQKVWPLIQRVNQSACDTLPEAAVGMVSWALSEMKRNLDQVTDQDEADQSEPRPRQRRGKTID